MKDKPKIAIISIRNSYGFGGVFATLKVVHDFCAQYFDPTVFYLSFEPEISAHLRGAQFTSHNREATFFGMNCVEIGSRWAFWEPGHYFFTKNQWREALKDFDYFFVVSATPIAGHPLTLLGKKFVIWISTSYDQDRTQRVAELSGLRKLINSLAQPLMRKIERKVLTKASHIIALSSYSKNEFFKSLQHTKRSISVCGYPLDPTHNPTGIKDFSEPLIIAVGRFSDPRKNFPMLMAAFKKIHAVNRKAHLCVIGNPPDVEITRTYSDEPFFDAITFTGQVSPHDLRRFYQDASLMLVTSYQEGFGIAALESIYYGTPVITTDCGGPRDFVINGYNGCVVKINASDAMAEQTLKLLANTKLLQEFSHNGHHLADALFKQSKVYNHFKQALINVYPELNQHFTAYDAQPLVPVQPHSSRTMEEASL